ncbi:MAG: T9SS type A sorting domain-containing protein [Hymenobacter sp.]
MKILFRASLLAALLGGAGSAAHGQAVANGDFETWAARNGVDAPTGWLTTDDIAATLLGTTVATGTYTKATDAHGGTYAVRLESKSTLLGVVPGALILGSKVGSNRDLPGGLPFTGRPATLQFYYKLSGTQPPVASNGAFAQVALTRRANGTTQVIATGQQVFSTPTASYVLAQVPLTYTSAAQPDSVRLVFASGIVTAAVVGATGATAGTVFQLDDVSFVGTGTVTATRNAALSAVLSVAPNPSPDGHYLLSGPPALLAGPLAVVDLTGRVVYREAAVAAGAATRPLSLAGLAAGLYTLRLVAGPNLLTQKLLIP